MPRSSAVVTSQPEKTEPAGSPLDGGFGSGSLERHEVPGEDNDPGKVKYVRRSIEMHPDVIKLLDRLQTKLKVRSHSDVLQRAVQLLDAIVNEQEHGVRIFVAGPNGKMEQVRIV